MLQFLFPLEADLVSGIQTHEDFRMVLATAIDDYSWKEYTFNLSNRG